MKFIIFATFITFTYCNILIIGEAGVGKSYLINSLLGTNIARESYTDDIGTTNIDTYNYKGINIYDTPGLFDIDSNPEVALRQYIQETNPFIIVVCYDANKKRLSNQDKELVNAIKNAAGNVLHKTLFVLTQVNTACNKISYKQCKEIIDSKFETLQSYGAQNYIIAGDKHDCAFYKDRICTKKWMKNIWDKITTNINMHSFSSIYTIATTINYDTPSGEALQESVKNNNNGCISADSLLGGIAAKNLKPGNMIEQNGQMVKVLFVYKHEKYMPMVTITIGNETVSLTANHYLPVNGKYIKARNAKIDGTYITNIQYAYEKAIYIVTELEDLYIGNIRISTYVWNYDIMRILHIPFRWILNAIY